MNKERLKKFIQDVWNEGNINAIPEYIAETYTIFHDPGDPWDGKVLDVAGFQERVSISRTPFPDQTFNILEIFESEGNVCITWLWQGTHSGPIAGMPPSGKQLTMSGATVYYFEDGRITGHWQVTDRLGIFQQMQAN